jgi:hypothetical protein
MSIDATHLQEFGGARAETSGDETGLTPSEKRALAAIVREITFTIETLPDFDVYSTIGMEVTGTITNTLEG